jgi:WD40 repeat protein/serine/threonine protein kinase/tetratricopeptide (TPR) repeat protein
VLNRGQTSEVAQLKTASAVVKSRPEYKVCSGQADRCGRADGPWSSGPVDSDLAEIVDEFTCRIQAGEALDLDDYVALFPQYAQILRDLLKDLRGLAALDQAAAPAGRTADAGSGLPRQAMLGDFAICAEIGRGGMGVVYEAEQISLGRRVALKVLSMAAALDVRSVERFQIEAQAAACLQDDHIVPVYAVGAEDGVPFYVMQYIEGASLAGVIAALRSLRDGGAPPGDGRTIDLTLAPDLLADRFRPGRRDFRSWRTAEVGGPDYIRAVVRLAVQAAEALEHAHDQGIIHRDIKPANLLLDHSGKLWITDFGLARIVGSGTLTATGDLPGTLRYMSPEQALGKRSLVDRRSDIYALGATLYELLSLEPAIDGHERWEILAKIGREEPTALKLRNPAVPRDLATIVAKAMAKDVADRYQTAGELAQDLNLFLEGRPINARPASPVQQAALWCRRNRAVATLLIALAIVFTAAFVTTFTLYRNETNQRIAAQAEIALHDFDRGRTLASQGDVDLALPWMATALKHAPPERPELARIVRTNLEAWEQRSPSLKAVFEHRGAVTRAVFRCDGQAVLTASEDCTAQLWDTATGLQIGPALNHGEQIHSAALSSDGRLALTGGSDGTARRWNLASGQPIGVISSHGNDILSVAFSPDGRVFATRGRDSNVRLWDAIAERPVGRSLQCGKVGNFRFSADSRSILMVATDGAQSVCEVDSGRIISLPLEHCDRSWHSYERIMSRASATGSDSGAPAITNGAINPSAFSPDGKLGLFWSEDGSARLVNVTTGIPVGPTLPVAGDRIGTFSPDGRLVLLGVAENAARLWYAPAGRPAGSLLRHRLSIRDGAFSPDGNYVLTASTDGTAKLWDIRPVTSELTCNPTDPSPRSPADNTAVLLKRIHFGSAVFSPDKRSALLYRNIGEGIVKLVDTSSGQPIGPTLKHRWSWTRAAAFSPDGRRFVTASHTNGTTEKGTFTTCQIWDTATLCPATPLLPHINFASASAFKPDGKVLATGDYSGAVHLWDVETGASLRAPLMAGSIVLTLAFSPDGRTLAAGTAELARQAVLWDVDTGQRRGGPLAFKGNVNHLAFSPDGQRLAIGSADSTVRLVDVKSGRAEGPPLDHRHAVGGVVFSPDSQVLLTAHDGLDGKGAARLWETATGQPLSPALDHDSPVAGGALAFSTDGSAFATGCEDGSVHLWDVASARPIGPPHMLTGKIRGIAFDASGRSWLAVDEFGVARTWPLPVPSTEPVDRMIGRLESRTGLALDATREIAIVDPPTWRSRQASASRLPQSEYPDNELADQEALARDAETGREGFAAQWHLTRLINRCPDNGMLHARLGRAMLWTGKLTTADAAFGRALDLGPGDRIVDWLNHQADDLRVAGHHAGALTMLNRAIAARPGDWRLLAARAEVYAAVGPTANREADLESAVNAGAGIPFLVRLAEERGRAGRVASAVALYERAIAKGVVTYEVWSQAATLLLEADDGAAYRRLCATLRNRTPAQVPEPWVAIALADTCTLGPGGVGTDGKVRGWLEAVLTILAPRPQSVLPPTLAALGRVVYRSDQVDQSIDLINRSVAVSGREFAAEDAAFLAMAYHQRHDDAKSHAMLVRLGTQTSGTQAEEDWADRTLQLLRNEAQALIFQKPLPSDVFAH